MYQKNHPQSSTTASTTALVSAIGFDTIKVFLKNITMNRPEVHTPTVDAYSGSFGTSVLMHTSHGPRGTRWETAPLAQVEAHVKAIAHVLTQNITLDRGNPNMTATYNRVWTALMDATIGRLDVAWDLRGVHMAALNIVCPKILGEMFTYCGRTSATLYWGTPGQARRVRVYDKRQQMLDTKARILPFECTRIELEMNGCRSVQDHLHIRTLRELLTLGTHETGKRIRAAMDAVAYVKRGGETLSPLFSVRGRKPKNPRKPVKIRGWKAKAKTSKTTANTNNVSVRVDVFTARAEPLPIQRLHGPERLAIPFSAYPPEVQDEILERVEMQDAEAAQRAEDEAEARNKAWWLSRPKETRDIINAVMMGRIPSVSEAWSEALDEEMGRAWREVADTWAERRDDPFYMALEICGPM